MTGPLERGPVSLPVELGLWNGHAVHEELDRFGGQTISDDAVSAIEGVDLEPVIRELRMQDLDRRGKTAHLHNIRVSADVDRVVAVGAVDDDAVRGPVAGPGSALEIELQGHEIGSRQVADIDEVGSAE